VTHDQVEALTMADVVAVMSDGRIEQVGPPDEVYLRPRTRFVATFLGEANLLPARDGELPGFGRVAGAASGQAVVRPEHVSVLPGDDDDVGRAAAAATIEDVNFQGARLRVRARLDAAPEVTLTLSESSIPGSAAVRPGDRVQLALEAGAVHVITEAGDAPAPLAAEVRRG
jgi:putative spermidine/putrescine transport system ATP-binding protein